MKSIYLIIVNLISLSFGSLKDYNLKGFTDMVMNNLSAASIYTMPKDNSHMMEVKDNDVYDYGSFDFIIVGAGSAGTLLANRLSEIEKWSILLLEAGGDENDFSDIPGLAPLLQFSDMNWGYFSTSQTTACLGMVNGSCSAPRGKVRGGTSTINAKMYVRGNKKDYDIWEKLGNEGWSYQNIKSYFTKTENCNLTSYDVDYHATGGLLDVNFVEPTPFKSIYLEAMKELGYPTLDVNGAQQIGASQTAFNVNHNGIASGGRAFIDPILQRKNFNLTLRAFVTKLLINSTSKRAEAVEFIKDGRLYRTKAIKEVILSAGAFNSPQLLMLSGIGPSNELKILGIETLIDLPVGQNLQDHPQYLGIVINTNLSLFAQPNLKYSQLYYNHNRPWTASFNSETVGFLNAQSNTNTQPDIQQILVVPPGFGTGGTLFYNYKKEISHHFNDIYESNTDVFIMVILLHPKSRGSVTLKSNSPKDFPNIDYNYFSDSQGIDIEVMYKGILETLKLLDTKSFKSVNATLTTFIHECKEYNTFSKEYWYCCIRYLSTSSYHPVGTTRMGINRRESVVAANLVVHGMKNLRVVDAGVIPEITSGNTNAPIYMIAEKAADIIKSEYNMLISLK